MGWQTKFFLVHHKDFLLHCESNDQNWFICNEMKERKVVEFVWLHLFIYCNFKMKSSKKDFKEVRKKDRTKERKIKVNGQLAQW